MTQHALTLVAAAAGASGTPERAHSIIGASSYYRWKRTACPGSVRKTRGLPRQSSVYAAEGTVAHAIGERAILKRIGRAPVDDFDALHAVGCVVECDGHQITVTHEMLEAAEFYADTVLAEYNPEDGDILLVEQKFNLERIHPGLFGTSDTVLVKVKLRKIIVFDLKYGAGIAVEAEENEQLQYYCVGGLLESNAGVSQAEVVIVQPRAFHEEGPVRRWPFQAVEIFDFIAELKTDAEATEDPNAPLRAGPHCKFCPAAGNCETLTAFSLEKAKLDFAPIAPGALDFAPANAVGYDPEKLNEVLRALPVIESWMTRVKAFARAEALAGRVIPGHKLVRGNGTRELKNKTEALSWLLFDAGVTESAMYTAPELKSVAQIEEVLAALPLDKKAKAAVKKEFKENHVRSFPGGLMLVPEEHKRKAVDPIAEAKDDFAPLALGDLGDFQE